MLDALAPKPEITSRRLRRGASLLVLLAVATLSGTVSAEPRSPLEDAQALYARGEYAQAITLFSKALADSSLKADAQELAYLRRGEAFWAMRQIDPAEADCQKVLDMDPLSASAFNCLGLVYRTQGRLDKAEDAFNRAAKLVPNDPAPWVNLGALHNLRGLNKLAINDENQALKVNPNTASAYIERATAQFQLGQFDLAIADETQAIRIGPPSAKALNDRGLAYAELGRLGPAADDLRQAARLDPANATIAANLRLMVARAPGGAAPSVPPPPAPPAAETVALPTHPPLTFTRPTLAAVPVVTPPARFCSAVERNKFMDEIYLPAAATAKANGETATKYKSDLIAQLNTRMSQVNDGSQDINDIRAEIAAYGPISDQAYKAGQALAALYTPIMAVPITDCGAATR